MSSTMARLSFGDGRDANKCALQRRDVGMATAAVGLTSMPAARNHGRSGGMADAADLNSAGGDPV